MTGRIADAARGILAFGMLIVAFLWVVSHSRIGQRMFYFPGIEIVEAAAVVMTVALIGAVYLSE